MWYHKTKIGTFWIVESEDDHKYYMGLDEDSLGHYNKVEEAIHDIKERHTGSLKWDVAKDITVPEDLLEWDEGEPGNWDTF
jgi:hypothetical protein